MDENILVFFVLIPFLISIALMLYYTLFSFLMIKVVEDVRKNYEVEFNSTIYGERRFAHYIARCYFYEKKILFFNTKPNYLKYGIVLKPRYTGSFKNYSSNKKYYDKNQPINYDVKTENKFNIVISISFYLAFHGFYLLMLFSAFVVLINELIKKYFLF